MGSDETDGQKGRLGPRELCVAAMALAVAIGAGLVIWATWPKTVTINESRASTTLPLKTNEWKVIEMDEGHNSSTSVLELEHGWLVYHQYGFGGGMAFVPKPEK